MLSKDVELGAGDNSCFAPVMSVQVALLLQYPVKKRATRDKTCKHAQVYVAREYIRGAAALLAILHLQLFHCHSVDEHECTKNNLIRCLFDYLRVCLSSRCRDCQQNRKV